MWPFVRPKPADAPKWEPLPSNPAPSKPGHNVEVITTLSGDVLLRITEGLSMTLKMAPDSARKLANQLNAAADAVDPDEGEDDESEEEPPSLSGIEAL